VNYPLPDLGDDRRLLCPLCFEAVEEASVEYREFGQERATIAMEDPDPSDALTFETVEAVVLSPCGHATHRYGDERPDLFLPWTYEDPGMSDRFEDLQEYLSDLEQRFSEFDIGLYGQVGPLHASQEAERRRVERIYVRFAYDEWTVPNSRTSPTRRTRSRSRNSSTTPRRGLDLRPVEWAGPGNDGSDGPLRPGGRGVMDENHPNVHVQVRVVDYGERNEDGEPLQVTHEQAFTRDRIRKQSPDEFAETVVGLGAEEAVARRFRGHGERAGNLSRRSSRG